MDAAKIYFSAGSGIDYSRSWHFKHHDTYCVAPIVRKNGPGGSTVEPETGSIDFFAVGTNCCAVTSSDFRCVENSPYSRSGLRVLDDTKTPFYRL